MAIDVGDDAKLTAHFQVDGSSTDPGTVKCAVKAPDNTTTTYTFGVSSELTKTSTGRYVCKVPVTAAGEWRYRWEGTSPAKGAEEGEFLVVPKRVTAS